MGRILAPKDLSSTTDPQEFIQKASQLFKQLCDILGGKLTFGDNIQGRMVDAVFTAANSDTIVSHGLQYTPTGYLVIGKSVALDVYGMSGPGWNGDVILLRSTAVGTAKLIVF